MDMMARDKVDQHNDIVYCGKESVPISQQTIRMQQIKAIQKGRRTSLSIMYFINLHDK
jgi:hypothetical protein